MNKHVEAKPKLTYIEKIKRSGSKDSSSSSSSSSSKSSKSSKSKKKERKEKKELKEKMKLAKKVNRRPVTDRNLTKVSLKKKF